MTTKVIEEIKKTAEENLGTTHVHVRVPTVIPLDEFREITTEEKP